MLGEAPRVFLASVVVLWAALHLSIGLFPWSSKPNLAKRIAYVAIGACGVFLLTDRPFFLPDTGRAAFPGAVLGALSSESSPRSQEGAGGGSTRLEGLEPHAPVVWWVPVSRTDRTLASGIARAGPDGSVELPDLPCAGVQETSGLLGARRTLPRALHYRTAGPQGLSPVGVKVFSCPM